MNKSGVTLYLHVHQPYRVRKYSVFDTALRHDYFDEFDPDSGSNNEQIFNKVADKSYRPMNALLLKLLADYPEFKLSLSITGTFIDQAERWAPDVLDDFRKLVESGRVEILSETYYHSLAYFYSVTEFNRQVDMHREKIRQLFGIETRVFRNTELAYNDSLAKWAEDKGFDGVIAEGWDKILHSRTPNQVYKAAGTKSLKLLLKNYQLSDDLAFRFGDKDWPQWPLTADTYKSWVDAAVSGGSIVNLFMDYETFGEHQWGDTGIFDFFEKFVDKWLSNNDHTFYTVSGAINTFQPVDEISMPETVTWADTERDLTAWMGNSMQQEALRYVYNLEEDIIRTDDQHLISDWRKLQTSDHFYYMCTKWFTDGDVHAYFSPYESPYDAFLYFINAIRDIRWRLHYDHHTGGLNG